MGKQKRVQIKVETQNQKVSTLKQELRNTVLQLIHNNYIIGHEGISFEIMKHLYTYDMDSEHFYHIVEIQAADNILEIFIEMIDNGEFIINVSKV